MDIEALKLAAAAFKAALQADDRQALIAAARQLVALGAPLGGQWQGLAQAVSRWGELALATAALDLWQAQGSAGPFAAYQKATMLARAGRSAEAAQIMAALPPDAPTPVANAYFRGTLASSLGQADAAEGHFRRAIAADPHSGRAWMGLAQLDRVSDRDAAEMQRLAMSGAITEIEDRGALESALGLAEHRKGNHATAFSHYDAATAIQRERYSYDAQENEASARIASSWRAGDIASLDDGGAAAVRQPIFVTGLPRSGTTLVEQILAAHSQVDHGGELGLTLQIEAIAGGFRVENFHAYREAGGTIAALRDTYLRLADERFAGSGRFVDKTLNQSRGLGPLSVLFPDAPVIWMQRDPLDNAFSIYRTWLANNIAGSWSLAEIAHHMRIEDGLLAHWRHALGARLLVVPYGELVDDPAGWIERITVHCGLVPEPGQGDFHKSARAVTTASALQVREPVNRRGLGAAEPYRAQMAPFSEAYNAHG